MDRKMAETADEQQPPRRPPHPRGLLFMWCAPACCAWLRAPTRTVSRSACRVRSRLSRGRTVPNTCRAISAWRASCTLTTEDGFRRRRRSGLSFRMSRMQIRRSCSRGSSSARPLASSPWRRSSSLQASPRLQHPAIQFHSEQTHGETPFRWLVAGQLRPSPGNMYPPSAARARHSCCSRTWRLAFADVRVVVMPRWLVRYRVSFVLRPLAALRLGLLLPPTLLC